MKEQKWSRFGSTLTKIDILIHFECIETKMNQCWKYKYQNKRKLKV